MIKNYLIFVPDNNLDEKEVSFSNVIDWVYKNLSNENVIVLSINDIYLLQYRSSVLDIINEENQSMLKEGEDDWVISQDIKNKILFSLIAILHEIKNRRLFEIVSELIRLLKVSIDQDKYLYFIF